jgi:hypothetical protein
MEFSLVLVYSFSTVYYYAVYIGPVYTVKDNRKQYINYIKKIKIKLFISEALILLNDSTFWAIMPYSPLKFN